MPSTDPVTSISICYQLILAQYHQIPTISVLQGDFNCGVSSHTDFNSSPISSLDSLNFLKIPKFPQIFSQILHFLPASMAGWNN